MPPNTTLQYDTTSTVIANLSLSHLGINKAIANLANERSAEANACRQFFAITVTQVLEDYWWPFATGFKKLPLIGRCPTREWRFSYGYPSDCLKIRRVLSHRRTDTRQSRIPFKRVADIASDAQFVYTDKECAEIEYTVINPASATWSADFIMAASLRLAANIAALITAGDPFKLKERVMLAYGNELLKAQDNAAQEEQVDQEAEAEWIRIRMTTGRWGRDGRFDGGFE